MDNNLHQLSKTHKQTTEEEKYRLNNLLTRARTLRFNLNQRNINWRSRSVAQQYNIIRNSLLKLIDDPNFRKEIPEVWQFKPLLHSSFFIGFFVSLYIVGSIFKPEKGNIFLITLFSIAFSLLFTLLLSISPNSKYSEPWFFAATIGEVADKLDLMIQYLDGYLSYNFPSTTQEKQIARLSRINDTLYLALKEKEDEIAKIKLDLEDFRVLKQEYLEIEAELYETQKELDSVEKRSIEPPLLLSTDEGSKERIIFNLNPSALLNILVDRCSLENIKSLCFELSIDYENLGGDGKTGTIRELIRSLQREDRLFDLLVILRTKYPYIPLNGPSK